jgi:hypothetical protein
LEAEGLVSAVSETGTVAEESHGVDEGDGAAVSRVGEENESVSEEELSSINYDDLNP